MHFGDKTLVIFSVLSNIYRKISFMHILNWKTTLNSRFNKVSLVISFIPERSHEKRGLNISFKAKTGKDIMLWKTITVLVRSCIVVNILYSHVINVSFCLLVCWHLMTTTKQIRTLTSHCINEFNSNSFSGPYFMFNHLQCFWNHTWYCMYYIMHRRSSFILFCTRGS